MSNIKMASETSYRDQYPKKEASKAVKASFKDGKFSSNTFNICNVVEFIAKSWSHPTFQTFTPTFSEIPASSGDLDLNTHQRADYAKFAYGRPSIHKMKDENIFGVNYDIGRKAKSATMEVHIFVVTQVFLFALVWLCNPVGTFSISYLYGGDPHDLCCMLLVMHQWSQEEDIDDHSDFAGISVSRGSVRSVQGAMDMEVASKPDHGIIQLQILCLCTCVDRASMNRISHAKALSWSFSFVHKETISFVAGALPSLLTFETSKYHPSA